MTNGRLFPVQQEQLTSDDYYTPKWVFDALGLRFDLDVCSPPGGVEWIPAERHYTQADDGLTSPWEGTVWMNPPYSNATPWVRKFMEHRNGVCLVPHAASAWHPTLWADAHAWHVPVRFQFQCADVRNGFPFMPVFFAAYGEECVEALRNIGPIRKIV